MGLLGMPFALFSLNWGRTGRFERRMARLSLNRPDKELYKYSCGGAHGAAVDGDYMNTNLKQTWPGVPLERVRPDRTAGDKAPTVVPKREGRREYRTNLRKNIPFEALVNYGMTYSVPWHILNLGLGGALVDMDTTGLRVGTTVDFHLRFKFRGRQIAHHIAARVTRLERRGVALQFGDYDDSVYTDLTNLLYDIAD